MSSSFFIVLFWLVKGDAGDSRRLLIQLFDAARSTNVAAMGTPARCAFAADVFADENAVLA
jgi:hypothetical protein